MIKTPWGRLKRYQQSTDVKVPTVEEIKAGLPVIVKRYKKRHLFGFVRIDYHVEDRRPDLKVGTGEEWIHCNKYKHFLDVKIGWRTYNWTFRTEYLYTELPYED